MASVVFEQASVDFPIYNASARSLRDRLLRFATGGQLGADPHGHVTVRAIEGLSLTLRDGDRVGLIGPNGSGKSTLLRLLCGVYAPSSGSAVIEGSVGSLIDISLGIDPEETGRENVYLRGTLLGMDRPTIEAKMDEIAEFSELGQFLDLPLRTYSSGMHLRLAFAVSTIIRPEILLMDEWLSVGDERFRAKAEARLMDLVSQTSILVIASHSKNLVARLCNRVLWLEHGRLKMDGDPATVAAAYFGDRA